MHVWEQARPVVEAKDLLATIIIIAACIRCNACHGLHAAVDTTLFMP